MDPDLLIIFGFVLIILMIVFPFAAIMHKRNVVHEERKLELQARAEEAKNGNGSSEFRKLEERVRVLGAASVVLHSEGVTPDCSGVAS